MKFKIGDKVYIRSHSNWPNDCIGIIANPPDFVVQMVKNQNPWDGIHRFVQGRKGLIEFFWVDFTEPQKDGDGDGPYNGGEVEGKYIALIN
jgi:hypothetical protein